MRYGVGASGRAQAPGRVTIELGLDGALKLLTGAVDLGQGSDTAMRLIVASETEKGEEEWYKLFRVWYTSHKAEQVRFSP